MEPLTVVAVDGSTVILSTGEVVIARYEKLRHLCEQLREEGCEVTVRTWWTKDGTELIEIHRMTSAPPTSCSVPSTESESF